MYKFLTIEEYNASTVEIVDGEEVEVFTHPCKLMSPHARVNIEQTEVVISCPDGDLNREQAQTYIDTNWAIDSSGEV